MVDDLELAFIVSGDALEHPTLIADTNEHFYGIDKEKCKVYFVMQSTGLTDKNGKEIFEGDILKNEEEVGVVAWRDETDPAYAWGWRINWTDGTPQALVTIIEFELEVIGNIYENPELLEKA